MISLDEFFPYVAGQCPGVMDAIMRDGIREAAIEFCRRARLISETETVSTAPGDPVVDLYPETGITYQVTDVLRGSKALKKSSRHDFHQLNYDIEHGQPVAFYIESDKRLMLGPVPDAIETLFVRSIVRPSSSALSVPDVLFNEHKQAIAAGARVYIRRNHQPWIEPNLMLADDAFFERAINEANVERARGGAQRRLKTSGYFF